MVSANMVRTYAVLVNSASWVPVQLGQLTEGDIARCYEPDGTLVHEFEVLTRPSMEVELR